MGSHQAAQSRHAYRAHSGGGAHGTRWLWRAAARNQRGVRLVRPEAVPTRRADYRSPARSVRDTAVDGSEDPPLRILITVRGKAVGGSKDPTLRIRLRRVRADRQI